MIPLLTQQDLQSIKTVGNYFSHDANVFTLKTDKLTIFCRKLKHVEEMSNSEQVHHHAKTHHTRMGIFPVPTQQMNFESVLL